MRNRKTGLRIRFKGPRASYLLWGAAIAAVVCLGTLAYYYVSFSRLIDERLHGERERTLPRVYARPVELRRGQSLTEQDLIARLNDLGYAQRARSEHTEQKRRHDGGRA